MKKKFKIVSIVAFIVFLTICVLSSCPKQKSPLKSNGVIWQGKQDIKHNNDVNYISIPGFDELHFSEDSLSQKVNLYNPEENHCYMNMSLTLDDDTLIWETNNIMPGYGVYEIELLDKLKKGTHKATYAVRCFDVKTDAELNGCNIAVNIYVK